MTETNIFQYGVASGDPDQSSVMLWTHVTPQDEAPTTINWRVATDENFENVVSEGTLDTDGTNQDANEYLFDQGDNTFTVKVLADGLEAGESYYYDFSVEGVNSSTGQTKTVPADAEELKFAIINCSTPDWGYYHAYELMANLEDIDAVINLGDYIYEYNPGGYGRSSDLTFRKDLILPEEGTGSKGSTLTLDEYRQRYASYRTNPVMQDAHGKHPFISVWDDHEVRNGTWREGAVNGNVLFAQEPGEYDLEHNTELDGPWLERVGAARQAYYEWLPVRDDVRITNSDATEGGPEPTEEYYRTIEYGDLADLILLDTRTYRDQQRWDVDDPELWDVTVDESGNIIPKETQRTMLGAEQLEWFKNELTESDAKWTLIGTSVNFTEQNYGWMVENLGPEITLPGTIPIKVNLLSTVLKLAGYDVADADSFGELLDRWDGYPRERTEIINYIKENNLDNLVFLSGDAHVSYAFDVVDNPNGINTFANKYQGVETPYDPETGEGSVGVEFGFQSGTSGNYNDLGELGLVALLDLPQVQEGLAEQGIPLDEAEDALRNFTREFIDNASEFWNSPDAKVADSGLIPRTQNHNPHSPFIDLSNHGIGVITVNEEEVQGDFVYFNTLDPVTSDRSAYVAHSYKVADGTNHLVEAEAPAVELAETFTLQILHTSDQKSGVNGLEDAIGLSAVMEALEGNYANSIKLTSGNLFADTPFYNASSEIYDSASKASPANQSGIADILIQNALGWNAAAIGNHEFDSGTDSFFNLIAPNQDIVNGANGGVGIENGGYPGTSFPYLATNLDYSETQLPDGVNVVAGGEAPQANSLTSSVVIDVNGEQVGVLGVVTPYLPAIADIGDINMTTGDDFTASTPVETQVNALIENLLPEVESLETQGINKIILMTQLQQAEIEQSLAQALVDAQIPVDLVIGGGSNRVMASDNTPLRDDESQTPPELLQPYPQKFTAEDSDIYYVNTAGNYRYLGQVIPTFNSEGIITNIGSDSQTFATDISGVNRVYREEITTFDQVKAKADPQIVEIIDSVNSYLDTLPEFPPVVFGTDGSDIFDTENPLDSEFIGDNQILFTGAGADSVDITFAPGGESARIDLGSDNDYLFGGSNHRIIAGSGDDLLFLSSGEGDNVVTGGPGSDQFWLVTDEMDIPTNTNIITDFMAGTDVIGFGATSLTFASLTITQDGSNTVINALGQDLAVLNNVQASTLNANNFVFA